MSLVPLALIAELTHRCPLHCVYCSNPLAMQKATSELSTAEWNRVFREAAAMGSLHVHLTGGEPLARKDIVDLVEGARSAGLYTNLITSGLGLSEQKLQDLLAAGLEHIQLSFQDSDEAAANSIAGARGHAVKVELARSIRKQRVAFTMNIVVHRQNLDRLEEMIRFAEDIQPDRLEIANVQYYGWALPNRTALLPIRSQVENSMRTIRDAQERLRGRMRIDYVVPDYYAKYPKACMGGWGRRLLLIDPAGRALPCHAAGVIPGLQFNNVRERSLEWIWRESAAFNKFRGEEWMAEPCRSCDRRQEDFGGCRCQAFLLTGDAAGTDPVCSLAPLHTLVEGEVQRSNGGPVNGTLPQSPVANEHSWTYRPNPS
ncbi:MAG TPA: pyrroloquinoline quinone biosynthesis protein PqqE [Terriglobales bacterium]|nr:pyrroloquinoline quinone biosynthesis protein PqqE [Terriglobales bacterium]